MQLKDQPATTTSQVTGQESRACDVFVAFGITGDLAKVMTFQALYRLERTGSSRLPDRRRSGRRLVGR